MSKARYYIIKFLCCLPISLCAMQENVMPKEIKVEAFVPYWLNDDAGEYIFLQPSSLVQELNKFRAVAQVNPYALIYLKQILSSTDYYVQFHAPVMVGKDVRYGQILQANGLMEQDKTISVNARAIAKVAIRVGHCAVFVTMPEWFDAKRVVKEISQDDDDAVGGVEYATGDVERITKSDLE
jgi:hypothetical protein